MNKKKRLSQKYEEPLYYGSPTTKAVGSNFITTYEPTALVVGARPNQAINLNQIILLKRITVKARIRPKPIISAQFETGTSPGITTSSSQALKV